MLKRNNGFNCVACFEVFWVSHYMPRLNTDIRLIAIYFDDLVKIAVLKIRSILVKSDDSFSAKHSLKWSHWTRMPMLIETENFLSIGPLVDWNMTWGRCHKQIRHIQWYFTVDKVICIKDIFGMGSVEIAKLFYEWLWSSQRYWSLIVEAVIVKIMLIEV